MDAKFYSNSKKKGHPTSSHSRLISPEKHENSNSPPEREMRSESAMRGMQMHDLKFLVQEIEDEWKDLCREDYRPISTALELLDEDSFGRDYKSFVRVYDKVSSSLQAIADQHKDDFARSVSAYGEIIDGIQRCLVRINTLKGSLENSREFIGVTNSKDLQQVMTRSAQHRKIIEILKEINEANRVFESAPKLLQAKDYYNLCDLVHRVRERLMHPAFDGILVVEQFKSRLNGLVSHLEDVLSDDLISIVFLKRPLAYPIMSACCSSSLRISDPLFLRNFLTKSELVLVREQYEQLNYLKKSLSLQLSQCIEMKFGQDSFRDLRIILESLNLLGKLPNAISALKSRTSAEIFSTVDTVSREFMTKYALNTKDAGAGNFPDSLFELGLNAESYTEQKLLSDFFEELFLRLRCIVMHHRGIYEYLMKPETLSAIDASKSLKSNITPSKTPSIPKSPKVEAADFQAFTYEPLVQAIEGELRLLLRDYLLSKDEFTEKIGSIEQSNELSIYNLPGQNQTDKLFDVTSEVAVENGSSFHKDVSNLVTSIAPGFLAKRSNASVSTIELFSGSKDISRLAGHPALVGPSIFHASSVLSSTVRFLEDAIIYLEDPHLSRKFAVNFLKEFLQGHYVPQLFNFMSSHLENILGDANSFRVYPNWREYSKFPIFKCHISVVEYIQALQDYLPTISLNLDEFYDLLKGLLSRFQLRCAEYISDLCRSALLKEYRKFDEENEDVDDTVRFRVLHDDLIYPQLIRLMKETKRNSADLDEICISENKRLLQYEGQLIADKKLPVSVLSKDSDLPELLSYFYNSMEWILQRCFSFYLEQDDFSNVLRRSQANLNGNIISFNEMDFGRTEANSLKSVYGELFEKLQQTKFDALLLIRMEIRLRYMNAFQETVTLPDYVVEYRGRPDVSIVDLNATIVSTVLKLKNCLPAWEQNFVIHGIDGFLDSLLYAKFYKLESMNRGACLQMLKNMTTIIQVLKSLQPNVHDVSFPKASKVFGIYQNGAKKIIEHFMATPSSELIKDVKQMVRIYYQRLMKDANKSGREDLQRQYSKKVGLIMTQLENAVIADQK
ncbi:exocyst complex subunit Sec8 [Schizosaccharomyces cryophilus OY26]|uniref:Exocyst complex component Sec8 n=1 Tax=Schizosaccharomyces cryophilus (strain OY26 / ATCC MYA-4695 / CBS 11777 / NBRC 106824 / NRRL Y48691) TaxID=653667 RepID=S9VPT0_SCHCR|nr:exocyst complex subunit Sec8 [Schizosaccharomyces cryophilus OY26]EPY49948.1 exocyst complex subunit Sec8 [Schizosaccharomyces cryophilus OY26]